VCIQLTEFWISSPQPASPADSGRCEWGVPINSE
jgi:hypothetical protein